MSASYNKALKRSAADWFSDQRHGTRSKTVIQQLLRLTLENEGHSPALPAFHDERNGIKDPVQNLLRLGNVKHNA